MRQRRPRHVHAELWQLGVRCSGRVWLAPDVHRNGGSGEVRVRHGPRVHERHERVHPVVDGGRLPGRPAGLLLRTRLFDVCRDDPGVPRGLLRRVHAQQYAVLGQCRPDVLVERPVGYPGRLSSERDLHLQRRSGELRVLGVDLHADGHRLSGWSDGRDMREGFERLPIRLGYDAVHGPRVLCAPGCGHGCGRRVLTDVHGQLQVGRDCMRQWRPCHVHEGIEWLLVLRHTRRLWLAPDVHGHLGFGGVHMPDRLRMHEQCERMQDLDDARHLRRGCQRLLLSRVHDNVQRIGAGVPGRLGWRRLRCLQSGV